jgi:hypothetical protein
MKLSTGLRVGILSAALVFGLMLAGCNMGGGGDDDDTPPPGVDKSALATKITQAEAAKAGVLIASKTTVAQGVKYTGQAAMDTFNAAITAAKAVHSNGSATKTQVDSAVQTLGDAITAFNAGVKTDGEKSSGFTADELTALITSAKGAKQGVEVSTNGADKPSSVYWITQAGLAAFNAAITAAEAATDTNRDAQYIALASALGAFNAAKQPGTKAKTLTVTGLSAPSGARMYVSLYATYDAAQAGGANTAWGNGLIQGGSATANLQYYDDSYNTIPWSGTGSYYVVLRTEDDTGSNYITKNVKSFAGDSISAAFSEFKEFELASGPIDAKGSITGSVTLTNVPDSKPPVSIRAYYYRPGSNFSNAVDGRGTRYDVQNGGSFSIPFDQSFLSSLETEAYLTLSFTLTIGSGASQYTINLSQREITSSELSNGTLNTGNVGQAALASATLSGFLTVHDGGARIARVRIEAYRATGSYSYLGSLTLFSPADNAPWSLTIPAQQGGAVGFYVSGYDASGNSMFSKEISPESTTAVSDQPITGIALAIGDAGAGRLSGTVSFTNMPSPAPYRIQIEAYYDNYIGDSSITVSGTTGAWAITPQNNDFLAALESGDVTVTFGLYVQFAEGESGIFLAHIEKSVNKNALNAIDLGTVSFVPTITLSGTLNVTYNGQPVPRVDIQVYDAQSSGWIGGVGVTQTSLYAPWSIRIEPFDSPTDLVFTITGYDASYNQLFTQDNVAQVSGVTNSDRENIAIAHHETFALPDSATSLTLDTWTDGTLTAGQADWYQFTASGGVYYVSWNDSFEGNGDKTADLRVFAYTSTGASIFTQDSGWTTPRAVSGRSGTIYLKVEGYSNYNEGTYAIKYSQSNASNGASRAASRR